MMFHNAENLCKCDPHKCVLDESTGFHSVSNEDEVVYEVFYSNPHKCCRVVMEIGAGDGIRYSTSPYFEEALNWRPLLIESNPDLLDQLKTNRPNAAVEHGGFCESDYTVFD